MVLEQGGKALALWLQPQAAGKAGGRPRHVGDHPHADQRDRILDERPAARARSAAAASARRFSTCGATPRAAWRAKQSDPVATPDARDKRFNDPEWTDNPFFDFLKQLYLLTTDWADTLVRDADGLDPHTRHKAEFYLRQIANAISPSNFVLTNPELLRETLASSGENLVRGMKMLAEDIEAGGGTLRIRQTDMEKFAGRPRPRADAGQGRFSERTDAAHPV